MVVERFRDSVNVCRHVESIQLKQAGTGAESSAKYSESSIINKLASQFAGMPENEETPVQVLLTQVL